MKRATLAMTLVIAATVMISGQTNNQLLPDVVE